MNTLRLSAIKKEKAIWHEHLAFWIKEKEKASDNESSLYVINRELKAIRKRLRDLNKEEELLRQPLLFSNIQVEPRLPDLY